MNITDNNKNSLKIISEKLANHNMAYDIDEELQNYNVSPKLKEKIIENIKDIQESSSSNEIINSKNNTLKASLISLSNNKNIKKEKIYPSIKLSPIKLVICKKHNKNFLKLEPNNYEVVCEKCIEEGNENQLEIINNNDSEENFVNCYIHKDSKGSFFCDDCKEFICKMCFAEEHRSHKCHLPEVISQEFAKNIEESIDDSRELSPALDQSINNIKKIYDSLKKQKSDTMKIPQNTLKVININNDNQIKLLMEKTIKNFFGIDKEINDNYTTFNILKGKTKKYLDILKGINEKIDNIKDNNNFDVCQYHKEKNNFLNEILNFIDSSFNFINIRLNNSNNKYEESKEKMENSLNLMNKEISNYEKSCISSISTGRENRSIILRRYIHFTHNEIKYFKTSIIGLAANDNIFLCGLSLCGLYNKKNKNKVKKNQENNNNINNNDEEYNNNGETKDKKINIQITISTMSNKIEGVKLFSQKCELGVVKGSKEPSQIINLEKGIKIKKEKLYLIKVENLSDNNYIDMWTGDVGKEKSKNNQIIRCHNTGIQFYFKFAEGIQTDFDEFENGIIEGILYSSNK